jgi:hypothetical protein
MSLGFHRDLLRMILGQSPPRIVRDPEFPAHHHLLRASDRIVRTARLPVSTPLSHDGGDVEANQSLSGQKAEREGLFSAHSVQTRFVQSMIGHGTRRRCIYLWKATHAAQADQHIPDQTRSRVVCSATLLTLQTPISNRTPTVSVKPSPSFFAPSTEKIILCNICASCTLSADLYH